MPAIYEAEVLPGLKESALLEIQEKFEGSTKLLSSPREDQIRFSFTGKPSTLLTLRTVVAIYLIRHFDVPRPRALLGDKALAEVVESLELARSLSPRGTFKSFRISAAGRDSSVMQRIKAAISEAIGLAHDDKDGALVLRIVPVKTGRKGWEVLIRLTARPLSTRAWRVCDMPGALNATIAAAMLRLVPAKPGNRFLNLMCGSGTLLIERTLLGSEEVVCGGDISSKALACSRRNIEASRVMNKCSLFQLDARRLPFPDNSFDTLYADFPWGERIGRRNENRELYRQVMLEGARVLRPGGRFVLITQEYNLLSALASENTDNWTLEQEIRVFQGGYHPHVFSLCRKA